MSPEAAIRAFVRALLEEGESKPARSRPAQSQQPLPLGPTAEQIVGLIDARLTKLIGDGQPTASAQDLDRMAAGWLSQDEIKARQQGARETYRPDGDYRDGEVGPTMPWIAPR